MKTSLKLSIIAIVIFLLLQIPIYSNSQSIGISTGYATGYHNAGIADIPFKLSVRDVHNMGVYVKLMNDNFAVESSGLELPGDEHSETIIGVSYRVFSEQSEKVFDVHAVTLTAGYGFTETRAFYRTGDFANDVHCAKKQGRSFDGGACVEFLRVNQFSFSCDFGCGSFSGFYSMVGCGVRISR